MSMVVIVVCCGVVQCEHITRKQQRNASHRGTANGAQRENQPEVDHPLQCPVLSGVLVSTPRMLVPPTVLSTRGSTDDQRAREVHLAWWEHVDQFECIRCCACAELHDGEQQQTAYSCEVALWATRLCAVAVTYFC
jgi:hypothetical protein